MCQDVFDREWVLNESKDGRNESIELLKDYSIIKKVIWASTISRDAATGK